MAWTPDEDATLAELAGQGKTKDEVAALMGRTRSGVESRARILHIPFSRRSGAYMKWTPEEDDKLRALIAKGAARSTCALGVKRGVRAVEWRAAHLGLRFADVPMRLFNRPDYLGWGNDRLEEAKRRWLAGESGKMIADAMGGGMTRSSLIAQMHRCGCKREASPVAKRIHGKRSAQKLRKAMKLKRPPLRPLPPKAEKPFRFKDIRHHFGFTPAAPWLPEPANDTARISHAELAAMHCRWPCGDPAKAGAFQPLFCGQPRQVGLPYCEEHNHRAYRYIGAAPLQTYGG